MITKDGTTNRLGNPVTEEENYKSEDWFTNGIRAVENLPPLPPTYLNTLQEFEVVAEMIMLELQDAMEEAAADREIVFTADWQETVIFVANNLEKYRDIFSKRPTPARFAELEGFYLQWIGECEELARTLRDFIEELEAGAVLIVEVKLYDIYVLLAKTENLTGVRSFFRRQYEGPLVGSEN